MLSVGNSFSLIQASRPVVWYLLFDPEEEMTIVRVDQPIPGSQATIVLSFSLSLNRKGVGSLGWAYGFSHNSLEPV